ncbi:hypothetical protein ACOSQ2_014644 [Xanthoceras sorbifolium]
MNGRSTKAIMVVRLSMDSRLFVVVDSLRRLSVVVSLGTSTVDDSIIIDCLRLVMWLIVDVLVIVDYLWMILDDHRICQATSDRTKGLSPVNLVNERSSEWKPDMEITALETYLKANESDAPAHDVGVEADLPVGSTDLPVSDLALGNDEIVNDTEKTTSDVQA